jgi:hypothetical protein
MPVRPRLSPDCVTELDALRKLLSRLNRVSIRVNVRVSTDGLWSDPQENDFAMRAAGLLHDILLDGWDPDLVSVRRWTWLFLMDEIEAKRRRFFDALVVALAAVPIHDPEARVAAVTAAVDQCGLVVDPAVVRSAADKDGARNVEIVNALVGAHFRIGAAQVQLAARDARRARNYTERL